MNGVQEAIILAAGRGTRLGASASGGPKCLVPVAGRPILEWQLKALHEAGVRRVVVVLGFQAEKVEQAVKGWGGRLQIQTVLNPEFATTNVLGSWIIGSRHLTTDHFYLHGDTVFEGALIESLLRAPSDGVILAVDRHPCGEEEMKVRVDGGRVVAITKQMEGRLADGEFTGVARISAEILPLLRDRADQLMKSAEGRKLFFEAVLTDLMSEGSLSPGWLDITGLKWREVDFAEDLAAANQALADRTW